MRYFGIALYFFFALYTWGTQQRARCAYPRGHGVGGRAEWQNREVESYPKTLDYGYGIDGTLAGDATLTYHPHWPGGHGIHGEHMQDFPVEHTEEGSKPVPLGPRVQAASSSPGSAFDILARQMRVSDEFLQRALMRHFVECQAQLRQRYVGMPEGGKSFPLLKNRVVDQAQVEAITRKMGGMLVGTTVSKGPQKALNTHLLAPFARVVLEGEEVLFSLARQEDAERFTRALEAFSPFYRKGLGYLVGETAAAASGVMNPLRASVVRRAKELDSSILKGLRSPRALIERYSLRASDQEVERLVHVASLDSPAQPYLPPPVVGEVKPRGRSAASRKKESVFILTMLAIVWVLAMSLHFSAAKKRKRGSGRGEQVQTAGAARNSGAQPSGTEPSADRNQPPVQPSAPPIPPEAPGPQYHIREPVFPQVPGYAAPPPSYFQSSTFTERSPPPSYESVVRSSGLYPTLHGGNGHP